TAPPLRADPRAHPVRARSAGLLPVRVLHVPHLPGGVRADGGALPARSPMALADAAGAPARQPAAPRAGDERAPLLAADGGARLRRAGPLPPRPPGPRLVAAPPRAGGRVRPAAPPDRPGRRGGALPAAAGRALQHGLHGVARLVRGGL